MALSTQLEPVDRPQDRSAKRYRARLGRTILITVLIKVAVLSAMGRWLFSPNEVFPEPESVSEHLLGTTHTAGTSPDGPSNVTMEPAATAPTPSVVDASFEQP